jgi:hypothetical protein
MALHEEAMEKGICDVIEKEKDNDNIQNAAGGDLCA